METLRDDMKTMIYYLMSGEEIHRINIIRYETTINDIRDSINFMKCKVLFSRDFGIDLAQFKYFNNFKMISTDFDIDRARLQYFDSRSYAWNLILKNENILKVNIIVIEKYSYSPDIDVSKIIFKLTSTKPEIQEYDQAIKVNYDGENDSYLHISEIDVLKIIFRLNPLNLKIVEYSQTIYVSYENVRESLIFHTSEIKIYGPNVGYLNPDFIKSETDKTILKLPINAADSISLINFNERLKSPEFKVIVFGRHFTPLEI